MFDEAITDGMGLYFHFHTTMIRKAVQMTKIIKDIKKKIEDIRRNKEKGKRGEGRKRGDRGTGGGRN
jgi:hypothetical protein